MRLTQTLKRLISIAMVGALLFAQMALAAYVCPMQSAVLTSSVTTPAMAEMPYCDGMDGASMDTDSPGLCHASCHVAGQSDHTSTVKLPVTTLCSLPFVALSATPVAPLGRAMSASPAQLVAASPPLSVLYCCFRI